MATIINTPSAGQGDNSWVGAVIGILVVGFLLVLFFVYGLPMLQGANSPKDTQINIDLPEKVDLNPPQPQPSQPQP